MNKQCANTAHTFAMPRIQLSACVENCFVKICLTKFGFPNAAPCQFFRAQGTILKDTAYSVINRFEINR